MATNPIESRDSVALGVGMFRYTLPATVILAGLVLIMAGILEAPFGVIPRSEHRVVAPAGQTGPNAGSVISVTSEQTRLQSEMDVRAGALRTAAAHQLEELEAVLTGPKARQTAAAPAAVPSAPRTTLPRAAARHRNERHRSSSSITRHD